MATDKHNLGHASNLRRRTGGLVKSSEMNNIADGLDRNAMFIDEGSAELTVGRRCICKIKTHETKDHKYTVDVYEVNAKMLDKTRDMSKADIEDEDPIYEDAFLVHITLGAGHHLAIGCFVMAKYIGDTAEETPKAIFEFGFNVQRPIYCKLQTNETGGGKYSGPAYCGSPDLLNPAVSVTTSHICGIAVFPSAIYVNLQENEIGTHYLTSGDNTYQKYFVGAFEGFSPEGTPRPVFTGNAFFFKVCPTARPGEISVEPISTDTLLTASMYEIFVASTIADITLSLLPAATIGPYEYWIHNDSAYNVIIDPDGSELIDGASDITLIPTEWRRISCDGTGWTSIA